MPISMACPQCSARFNFNDDSAGKKARCQRCQNVFTVEAAPSPSSDVLDINLELVDAPPPSEVAKPAPVQATPTPAREPSKAPARSSREDTSADDFDVAAFGGFDAGGKRDERPSRRRRDDDEDEDDRPARRRRSRDEDESEEERPSRPRSRDNEDYEDDRRPRGRRRRDDDDEPAFSRNQRRQDDIAERGKGSGIRAGKFPFLLKLAIFIVVLAVTAGTVQFWLKDRNEDEGTFSKIKKKVIGFAIVAIVLMFVTCGGALALLLGLFATRSHHPPHFNQQPGPKPQPPGPNPGPKPVEVHWTAARTPDPLPDWNQWKVASDLSLEARFSERAFYSERPGKFLALGRATNQIDLTVWNLETKQKVGQIKGSGSARPSDWAALSPDGEFFTRVSPQQVTVYSSQAGKQAQLFRGEPGSLPVWADFSSKDRLVALFRNADRHRLQTYDLTNGQRGSYSAALELPMVGQPTLSPNGRFFAHLSARSLDVYDMKESSKVNRLPALQESHRTVQEVFGLAYSPDGLAIAAYLRHNEGEAIVQWSVQDYNIARQIAVTNLNLPGGYRGRRLEWLPNRRGWLVNGIHFVDGNGRTIERRELAQNEMILSLRRIVNDTQMLSSRTEGNTLRIHVAPVPK